MLFSLQDSGNKSQLKLVRDQEQGENKFGKCLDAVCNMDRTSGKQVDEVIINSRQSFDKVHKSGNKLANTWEQD